MVWIAACMLGMGLLTGYSLRPGEAASTPNGRPSSLKATGGFELYVAIHPKCPCSRSSLSELARLLAGTSSDLTTRILLFAPAKPKSEAETHAFLDSSNHDLAGRLPGVELIVDPGGALARSLGATTSGHCVLLDPTGQPLFHGGVTPGRGHEGVSTGGAALAELLRGKTLAVRSSPTFGCPL